MREFGDDAERAFGADEQMRQVVAGRGFLRPRAGRDDLAVAAHHFERQHVVAHRAVAHRIGAGGARRGHAAERSVGAGIDREEQALVAQMLVQRLAGDAGLDHAVEVFGVNFENRGSCRAGRCRRRRRGALTWPSSEVPVPKAITGTPCLAQIRTTSWMSCGFLRHHHRIRRLRRQPGGGMGVLLAHRLAR